MGTRETSVRPPAITSKLCTSRKAPPAGHLGRFRQRLLAPPRMTYRFPARLSGVHRKWHVGLQGAETVRTLSSRQCSRFGRPGSSPTDTQAPSTRSRGLKAARPVQATCWTSSPKKPSTRQADPSRPSSRPTHSASFEDPSHDALLDQSGRERRAAKSVNFAPHRRALA